jgi:SagB-type dehydrogenase family enzyme
MARSDDPNIAQLFHLHSSNVRERMADLTVDHDRRPVRFRTYAGSVRVNLPGRDFDLTASLGELLMQRRSRRLFQLAPLALEAVGRLLFAAYGVYGHRLVDDSWVYNRPSPSAGGLYPLELYLTSQAVDGLVDGIYHYDARAHQLELRRAGNVHADLADMTIGQDMIKDANLVVLISAIRERTMWKYGQRGYRYVWLDAGHVGQNLYLVAEALGLGAAAIGGFFDGEVNRLLVLPPQEEAIYLVCVGQPRP